MSSTPLPNYLRAHRKRLGLSQDDVAFLLGCRHGTKVSRYERFRRQPGLLTVFACEILIGVPARELFAGVYLTVERDVVQRTEALLRQLASLPDGPQLQQRKSALTTILEAAKERREAVTSQAV